MLTVLLCVVLGWVAIKVIVEIVRISWVLLLFVGGIILVPIIIIGAVVGEVKILSKLGILVNINKKE